MQLPTRPTKKSDTRTKSFEGKSVEVDAIPAAHLRSVVRSRIEQHIDPIALAQTRLIEKAERQTLKGIADNVGYLGHIIG